MRRLAPYLLLAALALASALGIAVGLSDAPSDHAHRVTDSLVLSSNEAVAGDTIHGFLVIDNGGRPFRLADQNGCAIFFGVELSNAHYDQGIALAVPCTPPMTIAQGVTRLPVTISTSYNHCGPGGPACPAGHFPPPLPRGTYRASVVWTSPVPLPPAAAPVTLLPSSRASSHG
jgi:hypothetical protein